MNTAQRSTHRSIQVVDTAHDIMIDLETTGVYAGCCILSIGACNLDGTRTFYVAIQHRSCLAAGLQDNSGTLEWWSKQSQEAQDAAFNNPDALPLAEALAVFNVWLEDVEPKGIWGNGADFDKPILEAAYRAVDLVPAYKGYNTSRCYRTLKALYSWVKAPTFEGVRHNALADAGHQADHLLLILDAMEL